MYQYLHVLVIAAFEMDSDADGGSIESCPCGWARECMARNCETQMGDLFGRWCWSAELFPLSYCAVGSFREEIRRFFPSRSNSGLQCLKTAGNPDGPSAMVVVS